MNKAQTFPLGSNEPAPRNRNEAWMTAAEVTPFAHGYQQRVCYPRLEAWTTQDGERQLSGDLAATVRALRERDRFLGSKAALTQKWSVKFEGARRRLGGSDQASVPTIMMVAWDERDRGFENEDLDLWTQACKDIVMFLREHGAAYFAVEIVHWDRLDYKVVN
ncbi:hypothetical protein F4779DRAFT_338163 [Xylariaceae sp. FL0662B]|nr:hypothetical protein F4779DRAFT_338163 [Xylariaceae sp. FL0662B]